MNSSKVLELETRKSIYNLVKEHAGSHFRDIERKTSLAASSVKYHLDYLGKHDLIIEKKDGNNIRYFPKLITSQNNQLLMLLRQKSIRNILLHLINNNHSTFKEIKESTKLSPSTVSWHLKKLRNKQVISTTKQENLASYRLTIEPRELIQLLITYKESFLDSLVNKTIEMWDMK
jgi:predicted transcriptional regulator